MAYGPSTMLLAALVLFHHAPAAERWLADVLRYFNERFPGFGGDEGGYAQGFGYGIGVGQAAMLHLKLATGIDFFRSPWGRNHHRFILYFQPPYSTCPTFGDASGGVPKTQYHKRVMQMYAGHLADPYCQWYTDQIKEALKDRDGNLLSFHYHCPDLPKAKPPDDLPQAAHFSDVGWVAMHSCLSDKDQNIMLLAKSSQYGSFNHSHADQNSFVLEAYSRPLLIDSGYYPWYGSPHDQNWYKQTLAHNALLINGKGQGVSNIEATGRITTFANTQTMVYAVGDATAAYRQPSASNVPLEQSAFDQGVARVVRHFVFLRPDTFVILDDVETEQPASIQILFHALGRFEVHQADRWISVTNGPAFARIQLSGEEEVAIGQTDQFTVPPESEGGGTYPDQWHVTCDFAPARCVRRLLTVIQIARATDADRLPPVESICTANAHGARIGNATVVFDPDANEVACRKDDIEHRFEYPRPDQTTSN